MNFRHSMCYILIEILLTTNLFYKILFLILFTVSYTGSFKAFGRRNETVNRGVLGLLRSPKASLGPQGRAQITLGTEDTFMGQMVSLDDG